MGTGKREPIVREAMRRPRGEKRRANWPTLLLIAVTLAALLVVPFLLLRPRADTYTLRSYETAVVESGVLVEYVRSNGRLVPRLERSITAPAAGVLDAWQVSEGDQVEEGQVLGTITSTSVQQQLREAEQAIGDAERRIEELRLTAELEAAEEARSLASLEQEVEAAQADLATTRALFEVGAASQQDVMVAERALATAADAVTAEAARQRLTREQRELALSGAQDDLAGARARAEQSRSQAATLTLRAPMNGLLTNFAIAAGEPVAANQALARVASTTELRVDTELSEGQARRVSIGQAATLRLAGEAYEGRVVYVSPQAEAGANGAPSVPVVLDFADPPDGLRLGGSVNVEIEVARHENALLLPRGPYLTTGGERLAYVVQGDTTTRQQVVFGLIDGNRVQVLDGLEEGDRVITSSYEAFTDQPIIELAPGGEIE